MRKSRCTHVTVFLSILVGAALNSESLYGQATAVDLSEEHRADKIRRIWTARQAWFESFRCDWEGKWTFLANSRRLSDSKGKLIPFPSRDTVVSRSSKFIGDRRQRVRYEYTGPRPVEATQTFEHSWYLSLTHRDEIRAFYKGNTATGAQPTLGYPGVGFIYDESRSIPELQSIALLGLLVLLRPNHPAIAMKYNPESYSIRNVVAVGASRCVLLEATSRTTRTLLYLDIKRDYVPVRIAEFSRDVARPEMWLPQVQVDMRYADAADGKWKLEGWRQFLYARDGRPIEQEEARVTTFERNPTLSDDMFEFEFPVGTIVNNDKAGEYYILRDDGGKRHITVAEQNARIPYVQLLATGTDSGLRGRFLATLLIGIALCVLGGSVYAWRRR